MQIAIGLLLVAASFFVALREILLRPSSLYYPQAPFWLRLCLFAWLLTLFFVGSTATFAGLARRPMDWEPLMLLVAASTAGQTAAMTINILRQRYTPRFWERVRRLLDLAPCHRQKGSALAMLQMDGWKVVAPGEPLEHFPEIVRD